MKESKKITYELANLVKIHLELGCGVAAPNLVNKNMLTKPASCISESYSEIRINLNFYFHTSLRCLKKFYEDILGLH